MKEKKKSVEEFSSFLPYLQITAKICNSYQWGKKKKVETLLTYLKWTSHVGGFASYTIITI